MFVMVSNVFMWIFKKYAEKVRNRKSLSEKVRIVV